MVRIGAVGTGAITRSMLAEFQRSEDLECTAICSRSEAKGRALADSFGIQKVYTALDELLLDTEIDMVYIATPNTIHYRQVKAALLAGKHVLCEKPFVPSAAEAEELITLARKKNRMLFEAITTAHHPNYRLVAEALPGIGRLKLVLCTFCQYSSRYPALLQGNAAPVLDPAYAGGALMDINLYNVHFVAGLFGVPETVRYFPNIHSNGVDTSGVLLLQYPDFLCQCVGAKDCGGENSIQLLGENGSIQITPGGNNCQTVKICIRGEETQTISLAENPWYYEVQSIGRLAASNDYESCYERLETTKTVVKILEEARKYAKLGF